MELTFLGAAQEVGRSSIYLSAGDKVLFDCGLKIHSDSNFPMAPPEKPDAVVVSHAHLDHTGFLPSLFKHGSHPELICTPPTLAMGEVIVRDSLDIMERRGEHPYQVGHVKAMLESARLLSFNKKRAIGESELTMYCAGHIPGAAICDLQTPEGRLVYTGDFKGEETKTTFATDAPPKGPDAMIIESTYADLDHPPRKGLEAELGRQVRETLENGGSVLLPAFAIGRTQELMRIVRSENRDVGILVCGMGGEGGGKIS